MNITIFTDGGSGGGQEVSREKIRKLDEQYPY